MLLVPGDAEEDGSRSYTPWQSGGRPVKADCGILDVRQLQNETQRFADSAVQVITTGDEVLSVIQGEFAVAQPGEGPLALGSDSATTCHIVGFRNPSSGRTCLAHLDQLNGLSEAIDCMLRRVSGGAMRHAGPTANAVAALSDPLDLYIVGGYLGESMAQELSNGILSILDASPRVFRVVLACMSELNSWRMAIRRDPIPPPSPEGSGVKASGALRGGAEIGPNEATGVTNSRSQGVEESEANSYRGKRDGCHGRTSISWLPRKTGLAIDLASGRPFSVRFEGAGRGPAWEVRHARIFAGVERRNLPEIYDPQSDSIVVDPFPVRIHPATLLHLLELPDRELLDASSTSPDVEDERFVADVRSQFSYILARVGPQGEGWLETVFGGGNGNPLVFPRASADHRSTG
ncbi:unnamed protein product [Ascophyllum nodosum]